MKRTAIRELRRKLAQDEACYGLWVTLDSPSITEIAVGLGLDWVVIDTEHGHLDWSEVVAHLRATVRSDTVAVVRLPELSVSMIKRALDLGADGVVIPWVETADQLTEAVRACTYPPKGIRGMGGERATCWGQALVEHVEESANDPPFVIPIMETVTAARNIEALASVPGVDLFQFGPADFSATAGYPGEWEGPGVAEELLRIKDVLRKSGRHCGILATGPENLLKRKEQGFRFLGLGMDAGILAKSLKNSLSLLGKERTIRTSLIPSKLPPHLASSPVPLACPPSGYQTERRETITKPSEVQPIELAPGVNLRVVVGASTRAIGLTTGYVEFAPGAELANHVHSHAETITVLEGEFEFNIQGRCYRLTPLENIFLPAGTPHHGRNVGSTLGRVHVALDTISPDRTWINVEYRRLEMPGSSSGTSGSEYLTRKIGAVTYALAEGALFVDHYRRECGSFQMSGGYGRFVPGARLPCHLHDFDESISIIEGEAVCVVEGNEYLLSGGATALVPRGRCHYFRNDSDQPMAMIWVYAGGTPGRLVLCDECCHPKIKAVE